MKLKRTRTVWEVNFPKRGHLKFKVLPESKQPKKGDAILLEIKKDGDVKWLAMKDWEALYIISGLALAVKEKNRLERGSD